MLSKTISLGFPYRSFPLKVSDDNSFFQSPKMLGSFFLNSFLYSLPKHMYPCTITIFDDGKPVLVMPAYRNRRKLELAGEANGMSYLNLIYFQETEENLLDYFLFLLNEEKRTVRLARIGEKTRLGEILLTGVPKYLTQLELVDNVTINFGGGGYSCWHQSLSKSVRQNIRTAYNRLHKDDKTLEFLIIPGKHVHNSLKRELLQCYIDRHESRYGVHTSSLKALYIKYLDFSTRELFSNPNSLHAVLKIDGYVASFFSGYCDNNTIVVPRLSINSKYAKYSPGVLLICEAIKNFSENGLIQGIDLSMGIEQYKLNLGGTVYHTINCQIQSL